MRVDGSQIVVGLEESGDDWRYNSTVVGVLRDAVHDLNERQSQIQQHRYLTTSANTDPATCHTSSDIYHYDVGKSGQTSPNVAFKIREHVKRK